MGFEGFKELNQNLLLRSLALKYVRMPVCSVDIADVRVLNESRTVSVEVLKD